MTSRQHQTQQSQEQQAIHASLNAYLHLSPDAVLAVDARGRVRAANMLAAELFGYDQDELTALTVEQLIPQRFQAAHAAHRDAYGHPGTGGWGRGWTCGACARMAASSPSM